MVEKETLTGFAGLEKLWHDFVEDQMSVDIAVAETWLRWDYYSRDTSIYNLIICDACSWNNMHFMTGPKRNSEFYLPETLDKKHLH